MKKEKILKAMNNQVQEELNSSYLYLSMSAYLSDINLNGFAQWMRIQAQEELLHAMKIYDFIIARGGRVTLESIPIPQFEWSSPLAVFEAAYNHELHISACIDNLVQLATDEKDFATQNFLQWFVAEQVEEEAAADEIIQKLKLIGDAKGGLFMIDKELGLRTFTPA